MEEGRRPRERELVLAPNEYAYVLDTTKGHINCYVGPNKTSLAQTDQPVLFHERSKRFVTVDLAEAVQLFATAPDNWYLVLKNPAATGQHPSPGVSNSTPDLEVGRKIIVPGPTTFPLWPGQMVKVIAGHRLKSNQYLVTRVYDAEAAQENWRQALGLPPDTEDREQPKFVAGEIRVIRGTEVSFYIPPTGVEVVPAGEQHVRDAVTLERLEYCILVGEDGRKRFLRGERVVFPEPGQHFVERNEQRVFKAIELSELTGIYVKVISPYQDDNGQAYAEGEELFLTGKDRIYFPREEHAIVRYGEQTLHHALAIPAGEGRYVLQRDTGEVRLVPGPLMFLPDPRKEVLIRRVLTDAECALLYPDNEEARCHNLDMRAGKTGTRTDDERKPLRKKGPAADNTLEPNAAFSRPTEFVPPRSITLNEKYEGALRIDVWSGYAVQVVNRRGGRRVVEGPDSILLEYDETLESLHLSSGVPKDASKTISTAFLQLAGNQISDTVDVITSDLVQATLQLKYRVRFEEREGASWFAVENYVQLLADHAGSLLKARMRKVTIRELRSQVTELVRETILGAKEGQSPRPGLWFEDNAMRAYEVDVLGMTISDPVIEALLHDAQLDAIRRELAVSQNEAKLHDEKRNEQIERTLLEEKERTHLFASDLDAERQAREHARLLQQAEQQAERMEFTSASQKRAAEWNTILESMRLELSRKHHDEEVRRQSEFQSLRLASESAHIEGMVKQAEAFSPHLVETLRQLGDERLLASLSENFSEIAAIEGKGILETAHKFLDFMPTTFTPRLKEQD